MTSTVADVRKPPRGGHLKGCPQSKWRRIATEEAVASNLDPIAVMAGVRLRPYVQARWRAWSRLIDQGHSYKSVASASGFDHTTVMHGVKPEQRVRQKHWHSTRSSSREIGLSVHAGDLP
jgi:hypothetical protein